MKPRAFLLGLLLVAATAEAQLSTAKSTTSVAPATRYSIGQCHFAINDLQRGAFTVDNTSRPPAGGYTGLVAIDNPVFIMFCYPGASIDEVDNRLGAKKVEGKWVWLDTGAPFDRDQHFKMFAFSGRNWKGRGITYDDTTGDEATRQRRFRFCLLQTGGSQVLCGNSSVMPLGYPNSNVLPKIMVVLKSIDFFNPPTPENTRSASSATAPNQQDKEHQ